MASSVDFDPLLYPPKEPSALMMALIDGGSWWLLVAAAAVSIAAGVAALVHADALAALLGIGGGVVSGAGIFATNWASRVRDGRLAQAQSTASLGVEMADPRDEPAAGLPLRAAVHPVRAGARESQKSAGPRGPRCGGGDTRAGAKRAVSRR